MISIARDSFIERVRILNHSLPEGVLIDKPIADVDHNERARFLRNGLAIISFNILEEFIKKRIEEILNIISTSGINFNNLPSKIQEVTLLHSLQGIYAIAKRKKRNSEDWKLFIQQESNKLASSSGLPYSISPFGMGWSKSNLGVEDVSDFLKTFQINDVWGNITEITNIIGCSIVDPRQFFQNAVARRHSAAHDPNAGSLYTDIESYSIHVKSLALAFDFLISQAAKNIISNNADYLVRGRKVIATDVSIRRIRKENNVFKELSILNNRAIANFADENGAIISLRGRHNYNGEMIAIIDHPSKVYKWYTAIT